MKDLIKKIYSNQVVFNSVVFGIGSTLASFGGYLYTLYMVRMLSQVDYGVLASLVSVMSLLGVPLSTLGLAIVRYVSQLVGQKKLGQTAYFHSWLIKKILILITFESVVLLAMTPWIVSFLHLPQATYILLIMVINLLGVFITVETSFLQSFLCFSFLSIVSISQSAIKFGLAVGLVYLGMKIYGAVFSIILSSFLAFLFIFWKTNKLMVKKKRGELKFSVKKTLNNIMPIFLANLAFTSLCSVDVLLAKHFLPSVDAGQYAALSTLGKIIFFASMPIITVMFPVITRKHANKEKHSGLFIISLSLVLISGLLISSLYFLFPQVVVSFLFGESYLAVAALLPYFAVFITVYSLVNVFIIYFLSIGQIKSVFIPVIASFGQIVLIYLFHENILSIVRSSLFVMCLLLLSLLLFYFFYYLKEIKKETVFDYN